MTDRFTDHLHRLAGPVWQAQHKHPFVCGIGDGSLDVGTFKLWLRQDYLFLIDYSRCLSYAAARAPDLETMRKFSELAGETLNVEMDMHRSYAAQFGITSEELESEVKLPTTQAYTDFLVRTSASGEYYELVAALLPCMWGYCEVGQHLAEGPRSPDERYAAWIEMYSSEEFAELTEWCRDLTDRLASGLPDDARRRMEEAFLTCSRYEWLFWEMATKNETWPV